MEWHITHTLTKNMFFLFFFSQRRWAGADCRKIQKMPGFHHYLFHFTPPTLHHLRGISRYIRLVDCPYSVAARHGGIGGISLQLKGAGNDPLASVLKFFFCAMQCYSTTIDDILKTIRIKQGKRATTAPQFCKISEPRRA